MVKSRVSVPYLGAAATDVSFHHFPVIREEFVSPAAIVPCTFPECQGNHLGNLLEDSSGFEGSHKVFLDAGCGTVPLRQGPGRGIDRSFRRKGVSRRTRGTIRTCAHEAISARICPGRFSFSYRSCYGFLVTTRDKVLGSSPSWNSLISSMCKSVENSRIISSSKNLTAKPSISKTWSSTCLPFP